MEPNEAGPSLRGSFWSYVPPVKSALRSKKIDSPYWKISPLVDHQIFDLRSDQDHGGKSDLRSDQIMI